MVLGSSLSTKKKPKVLERMWNKSNPYTLWECKLVQPVENIKGVLKKIKTRGQAKKKKKKETLNL
jgi:hypothetical protein